MRSPFRKKALAGTADVRAAINQGWNPIQMLGGGGRDRIFDAYRTAQSANYAWLYTHSPAIRTVIDYIVRNIGELELRLYEEVSEHERKSRADHPAAMTMRYPNENAASDAFIRQFFKDFLILDNAYAIVLPGVNQQLTLIWVPGHTIEAMGRSMFEVDVYRFWRPESGYGAWENLSALSFGGQYVDIPAHMMFHWHGENPLDPRVGFSRLDTLRDVIAEDVALQQANLELAQAGLQEPVWISRPLDAPEITSNTLNAMEDDLGNRMRKRNRKPLVLAEGMQMHSFGVTPHDAEMMDVRRWVTSQVASLYGLPLETIGLSGGTSTSQTGGRVGEEQFYRDCLPPYCQSFTRWLNHRLLVQEYDWPAGSFEFNLDEKLMGMNVLPGLVSATGRAVMLTNEARAKLNLPSIPGGDELVTPLNVQIGDNPKPSPGVMGPQNPNGPLQDGSGRSHNSPPTATPAATPVEQGQQTAKAIEEKAVMPQLHPGRNQDMQRSHANVQMMQAVVRGHFNRLDRSRAKLTKAGDADWQRWDQEFAADLLKGLRKIVGDEGSRYTLKLAGPHQFDMGRVTHYLEAKALGAAQGINHTVRREIAELGLETALARASQYSETGGANLGSRTTLFARREAALQSPLPENRLQTWIADTDRHASLDGVTVPLGQDFPGGLQPGSAPGCKCTATVS